MKIKTTRENLLRPLQLATGVVERRQTLPVLANLLLVAKDGQLTMTGTDLEVEMVATVDDVEVSQPGEVTVPARKLADIWRSLPDGSDITVETKADRAIVRCGRSRFTLATLPVKDFPSVEGAASDLEVKLPQIALMKLIDQVGFSMAQQDVRYFLNGMLLEITTEHVRTVATDGHRLAMCTQPGGGSEQRQQAIVPRKGVIELRKLLSDSEDEVTLQLSSNHLSVSQSGYKLTTKLVDGKFPDYEKVIPRDSSRSVLGDREALRQSFQRASILSNEKYRGVRLSFDEGQLTIQANNPEQEEAEEVVEVEYDAGPLEIGFNVSYLQDILGVLSTEQVKLSVSDANSSALIEGPGNDDALYVVMPMRL
ncbi:MAG: DNA polymerase III subunit beta [Pseudomonadales bacterium]